MNYGAKVAKAGHSVANPDAPAASGNQLVDTVKEMVSTLSLAFILGATKQIGHYKEAYAATKKNPQAGVMYCFT